MTERTDGSGARSLRVDLAPSFTTALEGVGGDPDVNGRPNRFPDLAQLLVSDAFVAGASDIHIEPHRDGARVRIRLDGAVWDVAHIPVAIGKTLVNQFKTVANLDPIVRFTPRDAHASVPLDGRHVDLRLALAPMLERDTLAIRLLDPKRLERSITELGLNSSNLEMLIEWLSEMSGMFLSTGPTGSGKTTTVYALLHTLKLGNRVILSLEDPVEYQIDGISQIQIDALHHLGFADGIKSLLRHDPDYLMLGEIRDNISAQTAVNAAISGRVLLSTMHSRDCVGAISALRNWGLPDHEIAESVSVIVAQRLVRKMCVHCGERRSPSAKDRVWFEALQVELPAHLWEGKGCEHCRYLGYKGRTGVFELWRLDESDYQMILRHLDEHCLRMHLFDKGHRFLIDDALAKLEQGVTTLSELRRMSAGSFLRGRAAGSAT